MSDFQEEVYIIEKKEISEDEFEDEEFDQLAVDGGSIEDMGLEDDDDQDLNDFNALKAKTEQKLNQRKESTMRDSKMGSDKVIPKTAEHPVVIDDFIRNFLSQLKMTKTMNIFQHEWFELQKKGVFQDKGIGMITDIQNKNEKMQEKIERVRKELESAKVIAEDARSTWEKLRKERDYHKSHQVTVNEDKIDISNSIKKLKISQEDYQEKIDEIKRKLQITLKEKSLLKLEKDKLQKKAHSLQ
jgi:hypothetical protein